MRRLTFPLMLCACVSGCAKTTKAEQAAAAQPPPIALEPADSGLTPQPVDINGDGQPEFVNFAGTSGVVRRAVDLNGDGRFDITAFFDAAGTLVREEHDGDFDGRVDWVDIYEGGERVRADADTDYDGRVDVVFRYQGGQMVSKERL